MKKRVKSQVYLNFLQRVKVSKTITYYTYKSRRLRHQRSQSIPLSLYPLPSDFNITKIFLFFFYFSKKINVCMMIACGKGV